jgi:hypothetical protein
MRSRLAIKMRSRGRPGKPSVKPRRTVTGDIYAVEDYEGNQVTLRVGQGMKRINKKKVGDPVRAEITRGGLANSIQ